MTPIHVLIITALKEEYDAAYEVARATYAQGYGIAEWEDRDYGTPAPYVFGTYVTPGGMSLNIALARSTRMGSTASGPLAASLVERLRPHCLAMCGVCAGNPADVALGDVIIAEMVYQYDEGKQKVEGFEGDHRQYAMSDTWVRAAQEITPRGLLSFGTPSEEEAKNWLLERLYAGDNPRDLPARNRYFPQDIWKVQVTSLEVAGLVRRNGLLLELTDSGRSFVEEILFYDTEGPLKLPFEVKVGPVASGNVVVKDGLTWEKLKQLGVRSVLGLEMEAATIGSAAYRLGVPHWVVVKGVMDHADPRKDDRYKPFAALASAEVLFKFLISRLASPSSESKADNVAAGSLPRQSYTQMKTVTSKKLKRPSNIGKPARHPLGRISSNLRIADGSFGDYEVSKDPGPGDGLYVRVFVSNEGDEDISGVFITIHLDERLEYVPQSSVQYVKQDNQNYQLNVQDDLILFSGRSIIWPFGIVRSIPEDAFYLVFKLRIAPHDQFQAGETLIRLSAIVSTDGLNVKTNDAVIRVIKQAGKSSRISVRYDVTNETLNPMKRFDGQLATAAPGDTLSYRIIMLNRGPAVAENALVKCILPSGTAFLKAEMYDERFGTSHVFPSPVGDELVKQGYKIDRLLPGNDNAQTIIMLAQTADPFPFIGAVSRSEAQIFNGRRTEPQVKSASVLVANRGLTIMQRVRSLNDPHDYSHVGTIQDRQVLTWRVIVLTPVLG